MNEMHYFTLRQFSVLLTKMTMLSRNYVDGEGVYPCIDHIFSIYCSKSTLCLYCLEFMKLNLCIKYSVILTF